MALAFLYPFNIIYTGYILSENISVPLFLLAFYLSFTSYKSKNKTRLIFGVVLGLCFLTKYLFLPSIFLFFIVWVLRTIFIEKKTNLLKKIIPVFIGFTSIILPWLIYAHFFMKVPIYKALGFGISGIKAINSISFNSLYVWLSAYTSYVILSISFFLPITIYFLWLIIRKKIKIKKIENLAFFSIIIFTGCYLLLAIQHSWGATYNYPDPQYLIGRYIVHIIPLLIISNLFAFQKILNQKTIFKKPIIITSVLSSLLILTSNFLLYKENTILPIKKWFARIIFNSPDTFIYTLTSVKKILLLSLLIPLLLLTIKIKKNNKKIFFLPFMIFILFQIYLTPRFIRSLNSIRGWGIHGRYIHTKIEEILKNENFSHLNFYSEEINLKKQTTLILTMNVWEVEKHLTDKINAKNQEINKYPSLILSTFQYPFEILTSYKYINNTYYLYILNNLEKNNFIPKIENYEPKKIEVINNESKISIELEITSLLNNSFLINNQPVTPTEITKEGRVILLLETKNIQNEEEIEIKLYDNLLEIESNTIKIPFKSI